MPTDNGEKESFDLESFVAFTEAYQGIFGEDVPFKTPQFNRLSSHFKTLPEPKTIDTFVTNYYKSEVDRFSKNYEAVCREKFGTDVESCSTARALSFVREFEKQYIAGANEFVKRVIAKVIDKEMPVFSKAYERDFAVLGEKKMLFSEYHNFAEEFHEPDSRKKRLGGIEEFVSEKAAERISSIVQGAGYEPFKCVRATDPETEIATTYAVTKSANQPDKEMKGATIPMVADEDDRFNDVMLGSHAIIAWAQKYQPLMQKIMQVEERPLPERGDENKRTSFVKSASSIYPNDEMPSSSVGTTIEGSGEKSSVSTLTPPVEPSQLERGLHWIDKKVFGGVANSKKLLEDAATLTAADKMKLIAKYGADKYQEKSIKLWNPIGKFTPLFEREDKSWVCELQGGGKRKPITVLTQTQIAGRNLVVDKLCDGYTTGRTVEQEAEKKNKKGLGIGGGGGKKE
ncbi:MAG: hypothetical protein V4568_00030 [Pseudomonadota bacterium]